MQSTGIDSLSVYKLIEPHTAVSPIIKFRRSSQMEQEQQERGGRKGKGVVAAQRQQQQQPREPPKRCPRCDSTNTKFCYFNNYSSSQPRHFCKACRRYWTEGGTLRNVPQGGGGNRKGKRSKKSSAASSTSSSSNNRVVVGQPDDHVPAMPLFYGGSLGPLLQPFHPAPPFMGDLGPGFVSAEAGMPGAQPFNPSLLAGFNFPLGGQQHFLAPLEPPNLMLQHPRAPPVGISQHLNAAVFTTTTTSPAAIPAATGDGGEGFWINDFVNGDHHHHHQQGGGNGPRPPAPSSFI